MVDVMLLLASPEGGNFVFSLTDHAQKRVSFNRAERAPVAMSALRLDFRACVGGLARRLA